MNWNKIIVVIVSIILLKISFVMTGGILYAPAFILMLISILLILYSIKESSVNIDQEVYLSEKSNKIRFFLKLLIFSLLVMIGLWFYKKNYYILYYISVIFSIVQCSLLFRKTVIKESELNGELKKDLDSKLFYCIVGIGILMAGYFTYQRILLVDLDNAFFLFFLVVLLFRFDFFKTIAVDSNGTFEKKDWLILLFLVVVAFLLRIFKLGDIPPGFAWDERMTAKMANDVIEGFKFGIFIDDPAVKMSPFYYQIVAFFYKIFGSDIVNARLVSSLVGTLNVIFIYLISKELFDRRTAFFAALLAAVSFIHLVYSRIAFNFLFPSLYMTVIAYFLVLALRKGSMIYYISAGTILGFSMYSYNNIKTVPVILVLFMVIYLIMINNYSRVNKVSFIKGFFVMVLCSLVIFLPMLDYMVREPVSYFGRLDNQSIFSMTTDPFRKLTTEQIQNLILMWFRNASKWGYYNLPGKSLLGDEISLLFIVGFAYLIRYWNRSGNLMLLLWFFVGMIPAYFSYHSSPPATQRALLSLPVVFIAAGVGLKFIFSIVSKVSERLKYNILAKIIVVIVLLFALTREAQKYFVEYANDPGVIQAFDYRTALGKKILDKNRDAIRYITPYIGAHETNFTHGQKDYKTNFNYIDLPFTGLSTFYNDEGKDIFIMAEGIYNKYFNMYLEYFPSAEIKYYWNIKKINDNILDSGQLDLLLTTCKIPYKDLESLFGLSAEYLKDGKIVKRNITDAANIEFDGSFDSVIMHGMIDLPRYGSFDFKISGTADVRMELDNNLVSNEINYYKGLHSINITIKTKKIENVSIQWDLNGRKMPYVPLNYKYLLSIKKKFGAIGKYTFKDSVYMVVDPLPAFRYYPNKIRFEKSIQDPFKVEWKAKLVIPRKNNYLFKLEGYHDSEIYIDGKRVSSYKFNLRNDESILLAAGKHDIKINYDFKCFSPLEFEKNHIKLLYKTEEYRLYGKVPYNMLIYE